MRCVTVSSQRTCLLSSTAPSPDLSLRTRLRQETRANHEALDRLFDGLTIDDSALYRRFIRMNHAAHAAIEPRLATSPIAPTWSRSAGPRLAGLQADMQALELQPLEGPDLHLDFADPASAAGIAYVLEGSRLGAKMILKGARANGAVKAPTHYLEASSETAPFADFLNALSEWARSEDDARRCIAAADAGFAHFHALATMPENR